MRKWAPVIRLADEEQERGGFQNNRILWAFPPFIDFYIQKKKEWNKGTFQRFEQ